MKPSFTLPDILDIEFLFKRDEPHLDKGEDSDIHHRDRAIFIALEPALTAEATTRELTSQWLMVQRRKYRQQQLTLPGAIWQETTTLSAVLFFLFSLLIGIGLATSFLRYDGTTPVNVSGFFAFFILMQLLLLIFHLALLGYRLLRRVDLPTSALYALASRSLTRLFTSLFKRSQKHLSTTRRLDLYAASGSLRQLRHLYGNLLLWPAFILLQIGGIGFNLGVLLTLLAKVSFTDIAFGWQSTLPLTDAFLAELVRFIALPWSWLPHHEWAYPTLDQIIGSKIILIDGHWRLTREGLTSWWPFLLCGLLTYGLLPRLLLAGWGRYQLKVKLSRLFFDSATYQQLRRRMLTPVIQTKGGEQSAPPVARAGTSSTSQQTETVELKGKGRLILIPDELWDLCPSEDLSSHLKSLDNNSPLIPIRYGSIGQSGPDFLNQAISILKKKDLAGIIVLQEAWQPPIREIVTLLEQLRRIIGTTSPLAIALIGKPSGDNPLTPVQSADLNVWLKTTRTLADPYLDVFSLVRA